MIVLGQYLLNKQNQQNLTRNIFSEYETFNYPTNELFKIDVDFLLSIYQIQLTEPKKIRSKQEIFRCNLIHRDNACVITNNDYDECDAAHIIPLLDSNNYDIDNGILLDKSLHSSFDKNYWCIHPETLKVIINDKYNIRNRNLSCVKYENYKVNIKLTDKMLKNLQKRYELFLSA
jgi:hypothetical protein